LTPVQEDGSASYDLAIIGGGVNGCGIARDAAGRGWRVCCASAPISAPPPLAPPPS